MLRDNLRSFPPSESSRLGEINYRNVWLADEMNLKFTLWSFHIIHLSSEAPVLHLQLHDASTQQVGLLLHQLQVDPDLCLAGVGWVSNLGGWEEEERKGETNLLVTCDLFIHTFLINRWQSDTIISSNNNIFSITSPGYLVLFNVLLLAFIVFMICLSFSFSLCFLPLGMKCAIVNKFALP